MTSLGTITAALALAAALCGSTTPAVAAGPVDLGTLTLEQRLKLDPATIVRGPKGRTSTMAQLSKQHVARMARFSEAAGLAARVTYTFKRPIGVTGPRPTRAPVLTIVPHVATTIDPRIDLHSVSFLPHVLPIDLSGQYAQPAKDYLDFCAAAKASICLYIPANVPLQYNGQGGLFDQDLLVTQTQCAEERGEWLGTEAPGGCTYLYPTTSTVRFQQTTPSTFSVAGQCPGMGAPPFSEAYDVHGVYTLTYDALGGGLSIPGYSAGDFSGGAVNELYATYGCALQVTATPV